MSMTWPSSGCLASEGREPPVPPGGGGRLCRLLVSGRASWHRSPWEEHRTACLAAVIALVGRYRDSKAKHWN